MRKRQASAKEGDNGTILEDSLRAGATRLHFRYVLTRVR
jgi:hypothetical protein